MPPAACYHCYAKLAATSLPEPSIWTCIARCRRNEGNRGTGPPSGIYHEGDCVRRVCCLGTGTEARMDG